MKEQHDLSGLVKKLKNEFNKKQFYDKYPILGLTIKSYSLAYPYIGNRATSRLSTSSIFWEVSSANASNYLWNGHTRYEHIINMIKYDRWSHPIYTSDSNADYIKIDGHIATRAILPFEDFDPYSSLTLAQHSILFTFEASKLAKSLISLHDNPSCDFRIPQLFEGKHEIIQNTEQLSPNFASYAYNALVELDSKKSTMSDKDIFQYLTELETTLTQSYFHEYRKGLDLSDTDNIAVDDLIEYLQYLSLKHYVSYLKHNDIFCDFFRKIVPKTDLSVSLQRNANSTDISDSKRWEIYQAQLRKWLLRAQHHIIRCPEPEQEALRQSYIKALQYAHKHILQAHFHPDKTAIENEKKYRTQIFETLALKLEKRIEILTDCTEQPQVTIWDLGGENIKSFERAKQEYFDKIDRIKYGPSERKCLDGVQLYFTNAVKDSLCNDNKQGQLRDITQLQIQTKQEQNTACVFLEALFDHSLDYVNQAAKNLHAKLTQEELNQADRDFYLNLHYLMRYLPIMERTLELKGWYEPNYYPQKDIFQEKSNPATRLSELIIQLMKIYNNEQTRFYEKEQLRMMIEDIIRHQMGKAFLDVRYLKNTVLNIHQRFPNEPIWHRVFGAALLFSAALIITTTLVAVFAPAWFAFGVNAMVGSTLIADAAIPSTIMLSTGAALSIATATSGLFYARNRPFWRANYYLQAKKVAHLLTVHSRYEYAATVEYAKESQEEFLPLFDALRDDYKTGPINTSHWIRPKK